MSTASDSDLGRSARLRAVRRLPALPACTERSERALLALRRIKRSAVEGSLSKGPALPALSGVEGSLLKGSVACPFPHESPIPSHSPLLFANRGSAELAMVPSHCKQRATTPSNRGEMRVVEPPRHEPLPTPHPLLPIANRHTDRQSRRANSLKTQGGVCF
jgi:hypothetical protein